MTGLWDTMLRLGSGTLCEADLETGLGFIEGVGDVAPWTGCLPTTAVILRLRSTM